MRINTFFYTIGQGFRNIIRNKWFSLASIATIGACLFLFGLFYAIITNFQHIVKTAEEGVSVTVFFEEGIDDAKVSAIGDMISKRVEVANLEFVSAEDAWESFKEDYLGEYADGFTENPLENSSHYEIYLNDVSLQPALVTYLESVEGIRRINKSEITATTLSGINALIAYVSIGIIGILFAVSIFLISNTVTIGISVRKEEINIMKYIGATDFFVRSPFVIEGMLIGIIGSLIPLGLIYFIYNNIIVYVAERFAMLSQLLNFLPVEVIFNTLAPVSVLMGVGIGFLGSIATVRKHLRV
ncbi:permease-like cell division protein FtsX [Kineothrix sp. MB12-C1]|uniref:permease-like cell division protein FtsX n=1 Tax=Kineothrix sp. MB12-C1 TaxID=3070215 RepID=UPI0027D21873|nr:permease-like cell division protein FtsX [Kineothrix sp. MB12-C1]WMC91591.1 permease-like cell division protein FtsX [Kineothrix sp. MB12-C1]